MAHAEDLVSRQVMLSEIKRRLEVEGRRAAPVRVEGVSYGPCLLLSREEGSGGRLLAGMVGQRLGWRVFDREIVEEISERTHIRRRLIESVDDRVRSKWSERMGKLAHGEAVSRERYLLHLEQIILSLGHHGDVIIIGRGAQYLLPKQGAVRVRVVAPREQRARRVSQQDAVPLEEARRRVERSDAERDEFIRRIFGRDPHSPLGYDLVLNSGDISLETAAEVVLVALKNKLGVVPHADHPHVGSACIGSELRA